MRTRPGIPSGRERSVSVVAVDGEAPMPGGALVLGPLLAGLSGAMAGLPTWAVTGSGRLALAVALALIGFSLLLAVPALLGWVNPIEASRSVPDAERPAA